jgi:hypothetical protein
MSTTPQKRALNRYRKRLTQQGMARFEVLGLDADRELIRPSQGGSPAMARIRRVFAPLSALPFRGNSRKRAVFSMHYAGRPWSAPIWI